MSKIRGADMNVEDIKKTLNNFSLFRHLDDKEISKIVNISIVRTWKKGSHVFFQDDPIENVYFIFTGIIKIYKNDLQGKEQIVNILKKGEMFPRASVFSAKADIPPMRKCCLMPNSSLCLSPNLNKSSLKIRS